MFHVLMSVSSNLLIMSHSNPVPWDVWQEVRAIPFRI